MRRWIGGCIAAAMLLAGTGSVTAEPSAEGMTLEAVAGDSTVLQQGLTIHELDKELVRLKQQETNVIDQIGIQQSALAKQAIVLKERSGSAGKILRSYYMGQRDRLWMLLFEMRSLSEALLALDYLQAIVSNDFRTLRIYKVAYQEQQTLLSNLELQRAELKAVIDKHERQRERLFAAQAELDRQLAALSETERLEERKRIDTLTKDWEQVGVPVFEEVLSALSAAMADLPLLLSDQSLLEMSGTNVQIRITDDRFNAFLQERNSLFDQFQFAFGTTGLEVSGKVNGKTASFEGQYILEKEPVNALRFQIERILFNGFELPDTTRDALQKQYGLTFEPGKLFAGMSVAELANEEGQLRVQLTFSGFSFASGR
jgi:hypothetical protein